MSTTRAGVFDHTVQTANIWVHDVAEQFATDDRHFAYRVLRAWLHAMRDRLTVQASAHFAAQLPELVRGVYYEGWNPSHVPEKYGLREYVTRFAREAGISDKDVPKAASAVAVVMARHLTPGLLDKTLEQLPPPIQDLVDPWPRS